jgi:hypothetical protein
MCLLKHHTMNMYVVMGVKLHAFLSSALYAGKLMGNLGFGLNSFLRKFQQLVLQLPIVCIAFQKCVCWRNVECEGS